MIERLFCFSIFLFLTTALQARSPEVVLPGINPLEDDRVLWVALDAGPGFGSTVVALADGSRVFLPFQADCLLRIEDGRVVEQRIYRDYRWQPADGRAVQINRAGDGLALRLQAHASLDEIRSVQWFWLGEAGEIAPDHRYIQRTENEVYLPRYYNVGSDGSLIERGRFGAPGSKFRIYQMLPRLFGNASETRKINGTLEENGTGKFSDMSDRILDGLKKDGYSHIWLTGVIQHATSTDYSEVGQPADDPDLLKGIAGSPYAIRDYFDVNPDYADDPAKRLEEFKALNDRMEAAGLDVVIDFVPNHVARSYDSDIRPSLAFGVDDRRGVFFDPDNNFFYLTEEVAEGEAPLRLPTVDPSTGRVINETARLVGGADGLFEAERRDGRVTGNNVVSWRPSEGDWYETVKVNYGYNFLKPEQLPEHPSAVTPQKPIPDTWLKMDAILAYWQGIGVDGFRVDMAHMVPPEFWKWAIHRAQSRDPDVFFMAEAYDDDPAKVDSRDPVFHGDDNVMLVLLDGGFDAVYDDPGYDTLEHLYDNRAWANDLEATERALGPFFFDCAVRYTENHDEIRLANPGTWGNHGMEVGRPVTATLFGLSRGPVMVYHGQKVGEPGLGREGFGGDDARTTIFDYWSMPEFNKWWNYGRADGGKLTAAQRELRDWYVRLLHLMKEPAFASGNSIPLNFPNRDNPFYGKVEDVGPAGHWFYSYLRSDPEAGSPYLVTSNFHAAATLRHVRVKLPASALEALDFSGASGQWLVLTEKLADDGQAARAMPLADAIREGIYLDGLKPLSAYYWKMELAASPPENAVISPALPVGDAYLGAPQLLRLRSGEGMSLDLRRYGNPGLTHRFEVEAVDGIEVTLDRLNHRLHLRAEAGTRGLKQVPLRLEPLDAASDEAFLSSRLTIAVDHVPMHTFELSGRGQAGSVSVVGAFNDWNAGANPMQRVDDGWRATMALAPGRYAYKFVVDGSWEPDPTNPQTEADGHGGYNSILQVGAGQPQVAPTLFVEQVHPDWLTLRSNEPIAALLAEALPDGGGSIQLPTRNSGGQLAVDLSDVPPGTLIRVLAEGADGKVGLPAIAFASGPRGDIWQDDIIYYAFTDRFYDGNPANTEQVDHPEVAPIANYKGGDFQGIEAKLEAGYFDALGVNVLWLAPLNQNPAGAWSEYLPPFRHYTGYHGYWPVERFGVEDRFGGDVALRSLVAKTQLKGMKILADLVLKHVHIKNPIRRERPELFGQLELSDGTRNLRRWNDNPFTTWFEPFLPAFDFRNPASIDFLLEDAEYWLSEYGLDGYRLDAVKHIRPDFWWRFRSRMRDQFPGANHYFVGETFQNRQGIADFVGPNMLDGQFDFPLYDILIPVFAQHTAGFGQLEEALRRSEEVYGRSVRMSPLLGNHDKPRFMAYADGDLPDPLIADEEEVGWAKRITVDDPASYEKLKMAMTFLLTIDGVPMIYYGDEIGMTGAGDPDNRRLMRFGGAVESDEAAVREHFSRLAHARRAHPALYMGSRRVLQAGDETYAYVRAHEGNRALVVFNRSAAPVTFELSTAPEIDAGRLRDLISGNEVSVVAGQLALRLPPMSSAVFVNAETPNAN